MHCLEGEGHYQNLMSVVCWWLSECADEGMEIKLALITLNRVLTLIQTLLDKGNTKTEDINRQGMIN